MRDAGRGAPCQRACFVSVSPLRGGVDFSTIADDLDIVPIDAVWPGTADRVAARIRLKASQSIGFCFIVRLSWRRVRASVASGQPRAVTPITWSKRLSVVSDHSDL